MISAFKPFEDALLRLKAQQAENRRLYGRSYNTDYLDYRSETIYRWHIRFDIHSFNVHGKLLIPKESLLDFVESPEFHLVERKSKFHYDLIRRAYYE